MKILSVEWRNFSSYGNKKQSLLFPDDASLFQVVGENGAGKTSISQAICFALYGKIEGKKLGDIPNRINGNAWVKIEFENNQKVVTVERGLEPTVFNLSINGVSYDQAGQRNIQDYLSEELIGIPYYVFNNTISLSINDFKSFIKMTPQDKRAIVDKIFGFHILNQMREVLKGESKKIKEKTDILSAQLKTMETSLERSSSEMESLLSRIEESTQNEITSLEKSLQDFLTIQAMHSEKIKEFRKIESEFGVLFSDCQRLLIESQTRIVDVRKKIKLYQGENCPTCQTPLDGEIHDRIRAEIISEEEKYISQIKESEISKQSLLNKESELKQQKADLINRSSKIDFRIKELSNSINNLKAKKTEDQVSSLKNIIKNLEDEEAILKSNAIQTSEKNIWLKNLDDILGERGVKQMAIRTILPALNSEISDLLADLHLDYQVFFDEEFKASIHHLGIEIPSQTLSTGEMKKVDFVVLISIMKLMKFKFSTINLLFLDELFSSVDPDGVHSILAILKNQCKLLGLNIFVINHAPMPHEIFDWKIEVKKINNFSSISVDKF